MKKDKKTNPESEHILDQLIALMNKMGIIVKYDRGNFKSGLVKYEDNDIFYINRKAQVEIKINNIVEELKNLQIPSRLIDDELKQFFVDTDLKIENRK